MDRVAAAGTRRDRRPRPRRDAVATQRSRHRRMLLATGWYLLLCLLLVSVFVTLLLGLLGQLSPRPAGDALRLAGLGLMAFGISLQVLMDYVSGPAGGEFIRFTRTGWRLGAPLWVVGLAALGAGSVLARE